MLASLRLKNFKSLVDFQIQLPKFTVLIGLNGSGKTTILQAFDFLSQLMIGDVDKWLATRGWSASDLSSKSLHQSNMIFALTQWLPKSTPCVWAGSFNRKELALLFEDAGVLRAGQSKGWKEILSVHDRRYLIENAATKEVSFTYQGSILSQLRESELTNELLDLRNSFREIRSLELLAPHLMRTRTRDTSDDIGFGGERLSSFLYGLTANEKAHLLKALKRFYPRLVDYRAAPIKGGWKRLTIVEAFNGKLIETEARHINDGLLRVLAILAQTTTKRSMLLFDEIENGVNPEIVEKVVDMLVAAPQQIIVTTHSPMILNYLDDEVARKSVQFVYKTADGHTRVRPFFELPGIAEKLDFMGPGEAFIDTDLVKLTAQCNKLDMQKTVKKVPIVGRQTRRKPSSQVAAQVGAEAKAEIQAEVKNSDTH